MKTKVKNGSKPQAAEELINQVAQMPKKLLEKHNIQLPVQTASVGPTATTSVPTASVGTKNVGPVPTDSVGKPKLMRARTAGYYETGMALNITHGIQVVDYLITYGTEYNPSNPAIAVASLQTMNTTGQELLNKAREKMQEKKLTTQARQDVYGDLKPLATRILNELEASGAPQATIDNARHYVRKIRGQRIIKIDPDSTANHVSASQTSFTEQIQHFTDLINVLTPCTQYQPNIPELQLTALVAKRDAMQATNNAVSTAQAVWSTSRVERNQFFNQPVTGYVDTFLAVKRAVKAIFGANSPQYEQLGDLSFKRIRK